MVKNNIRVRFAVLSLFIIISLFSDCFTTFASEIRFSSDLGEFLTGWRLTAGDNTYDQDTPGDKAIEYKKGVLYNLELFFEERNDLQLETDSRPLTFPMPAGFRISDDFSMMMNVDLGKWGTLANNPVTYDKENNQLILRWNTSDTVHMTKFRDSSSAVIHITLSGYPGGNENEVFSIGGKTYSLRAEDKHNASVTKDGSYDPVSKCITYRIEVSSEGTTSELTLTDTPGTALSYNGDIRFESSSSVNTAKTTPVITQKTGNTFSVNIPSMNDKDRLVFTYSAAVDPDKIAHSGNASFEETGNTARIFGDSYTADNTATHYESAVEFSDLVKNSTASETEYRNGIPYYNIDWQIVTNKDQIYSLSGTDITDKIDESVQDISAYYGEGVEILCLCGNSLEESRFITWDELGIDPGTDKGWTYHIPESDPTYKYILNYRTTVNMDNKTSSVVVRNTAAGKGGIDSAYEVLNPVGNDLGITKTAALLSPDSVTWEMKIHLSGNAFERSKLVLTEHQNSQTKNGSVTWRDDYLPYKWLDPDGNGNVLCKEILDTIEISGLYENETFVLNYGNLSNDKTQPDRHEAGSMRKLTAADSWHSNKWNPEKLSVEFFRNMEMTQGGLNRPPEGTGERTITVRLRTKFPEEWAQYARQQNIRRFDNNTWYYEHLNWADIDGAYDVAKIAPYPVGVYKRVLRDASSASSANINMVRNGHIYPVYYYQVLVSGVDSDTPLVIDDMFDTSVFELYKPHEDAQISESDYYNDGKPHSWDNWYYTKYGGISEYDWLKPELGTCQTVNENKDQYLTEEETDFGVRFTMEQIPKDKDNNYYKFYGVEYWLTPKNEEALKKIESMAASSETGEAVFTNTASCRGETATARVALKSRNDFTPVDKTSEQFVEYTDHTRSGTDQLIPGKDISRYVIRYRVDINKEKAELNSGNDYVAEDSYCSGLSVDYQTISIRTEPENKRVSYDFSGNTGRFTVPDRTHVIIEYDATVTASGDSSLVTAENTVTMLGFSKTRTDDVIYSGSAGSYAANPSIFIKKYERGHMESGLNGAVFQLFRYKSGASGNTIDDWEPMVYADKYSPSGSESIDNPNKGKIITFTTGNLTIEGKNYGDGYADVELTNTVHGLNLEYDTVYGLREIKTPVRESENGKIINYSSPHNADFYCYKFTLAKNPSDVDYSNYIYHPDDILTVKNDAESTGIRINKIIDGNCQLSDEEKNKLSFQLYYEQSAGGIKKYMPVMTTVRKNGADVSIVDPAFANISYSDIAASENGYSIEGIRLSPGEEKGRFLLVERGNEDILSLHPDWSWSGSFQWNNGRTAAFDRSEITVFDENGDSPEKVHGIEFEITAYDIRENDQKTITLKNKYTRETVTLSADKKWISPSGSAIGWPSGRKVVLELGKIVNGQFVRLDDIPPVELDNKADQSGEDSPGTAVFHDLPVYAEGTRAQPVKYAVREINGNQGYDVVYPAENRQYAVFGEESSVVIKNKVRAVSVTVNKKWDVPGKNTAPEGASALMRLYSYTGADPSAAVWVSNVNDILLDGTADQNGEESPWTAVFSDLPEYDGSGAKLTYIVKEQQCSPAGYSSVQDHAADHGTITNSPSVTSFSVTKKWQGTENASWPGETEISFILKRKTRQGTADDSFYAEYILKRDSVKAVSEKGANSPGTSPEISWDGSELKISGLEKASSAGEDWLYYIAEKTSGGYDIVYRNRYGYKLDGMTYSSGSVTNIKAVRDLTVMKKVSGSSGSKSEEFEFEIKLSQSDDNTPFTESLSFEKKLPDGTASEGTLSLDEYGTGRFRLSHNESITIKNIRADLNYIIEETGKQNGYTTSVSADASSPLQRRSISGRLTEDTVITFENNREGFVPTNADIFFPCLPWAITSGIILCLMCYCCFRVRKKRSL